MKSQKYFEKLKFKIKAGFVLIILGMVWSSGRSSAFGIDYFEITSPRFVPVKVGFYGSTDKRVLDIQNVFKENLEKGVFFQIIEGTKRDILNSDDIIFRIQFIAQTFP